ncbi:hypothetical protein EWB00_000071 [Schistosoma japonicum]|uniref:Uncharacterized protein n=1 Tax=Schistosoma japonicum TaxID=6182 RepID=A0A4Z2DKD7_SCHJA|nr:hypothetical protein EWB00_000071 [Schistosoma japonicum]
MTVKTTQLKKTSDCDNHKTQSKWNRTQQLSSQQISKSKRSKNILAINTYRSEFLNNEEDRALFAKQRSIVSNHFTIHTQETNYITNLLEKCFLIKVI